MEKLKDFLRRPEVRKMINKPVRELATVDMNRDPFRPVYYDKRFMLSPADGFTLYAEEMNPKQDIVNVKGQEYTINSLLREEIKERCLVIGIFMTIIDVHVNRMPTNGFVSFDKLPCLKVQNLSMRPIEKAILDNMKIDTNMMRYGPLNEAMKNRIMAPFLGQHYWLLQIADFEVDVIVPFGEQNAFWTQGERFSLVRLGSQVDIVIPLIKGGKRFKCLIPDDGEIYHLTAGVDRIVEIK